jgi:hypothetical protein
MVGKAALGLRCRNTTTVSEGRNRYARWDALVADPGIGITRRAEICLYGFPQCRYLVVEMRAVDLPSRPSRPGRDPMSSNSTLSDADGQESHEPVILGYRFEEE